MLIPAVWIRGRERYRRALTAIARHGRWQGCQPAARNIEYWQPNPKPAQGNNRHHATADTLLVVPARCWHLVKP
jgi:hypothetical protein